MFIALMRQLILVVFLAAYFALLYLVGNNDMLAMKFNDPDGGNRDAYSPMFNTDRHPFPEIIPSLFSPNALLAMAELSATDGNLDQAKQQAFTALQLNPANGQTAIILMDFYTKPDLYAIDMPDQYEETEENMAESEEESDSSDTSIPVSDEKPDTLPETIQDVTDINSTAKFAPLSGVDKEIADNLAKLSHQLRPAHNETLMKTASYWAAHNQLEQAVRLWSTQLESDMSVAQEIFPVFHTNLNTPEHSKTFDEFIASPPNWWLAFFQYLLEHEPDPQKLHTFYSARQNSASPPDMTERDVYVNYLIKNNRWPDAYQTWNSNLTAEEKRLNDPLYDGGFEDDKGINHVFKWSISNPIARLDKTEGMTGEHALHIALKKSRSINFQHVSQTRTLQPGMYRMTGRYRPDHFQTNKGLYWRIRCADSNATLLAESEAFKGQSDWKEFSIDFSVPNECGTQLIRLETYDSYAHNNVFDGDLWFDDLKIKTNP